MAFTLDSTYLIVAGVALLIGLLLGISFGAGPRRRVAILTDRVKALELDIDVREAEKARLNRELASASDQVRPLSDEVDRLRRERDQRKAAIAGNSTVPVTPESMLTADRDTDLAPAPLVMSDPVSPSDDNLLLLKGVGDRFAAALNSIGVTRYRQIADWSPEEEAAADAQLGNFRGRIARDRLVEQAQLLADGRITEYEARFGKLGA